MTKKMMKLLNPSTGLMECKICGRRHIANLKGGGHYNCGSWQCIDGNKLQHVQMAKEKGWK